MLNSLEETPKEVKHQIIIKIILSYWEKFLSSEHATKNPVLYFRAPLKRDYIFQDFQRMAQAFLTDIQPYKDMFREVFLLPRLANILLITRTENYFNLPFDFLRFHVILRSKKAKAFVNSLKIRRFHSLEHFIGILNKKLYESKIRLTETDIKILREFSRANEVYFVRDRTMGNRSAVLAERLSAHPITIERSLYKMSQLGILKYTGFIDYSKLGLVPYIVRYSDQFRFHPLEEEYIPFKVSMTGGTENFAVILIPKGLEDPLAQDDTLQLIPLTQFQTFWNFTIYNSKEIPFPKALSISGIERDEVILPDPLGISFSYQEDVGISFDKVDLTILYEFTFGKTNQEITESLVQRGIDISSSWVWKKTRSLLKKEVLHPYFYVLYVGLHPQCFIYAKGQREQIQKLEQILRFMINVRHYFGQDSDGQAILFSRIRMPPMWIYHFYSLLNDLKELQFDTLLFGWCPWLGASRRIHLYRLWNELEEYWNYPYHLR